MIQKLKENIGNNNLKKSFMFRVSRNFYADLFYGPAAAGLRSGPFPHVDSSLFLAILL